MVTGRSSPSDSKFDSTLRELPPSAKLVAKTLEYEGDLTQSELSDSTRLPERTVRYALSELEELGLVTSRISFIDARQRIYSLDTGCG